MKLPIYMDAHATTPVDPRVLQSMLPFFTETFGNSASRSHPFGWAAEEAVDAARKRVANLIGARPKEIVFTSGATEANNLALKGIVEQLAPDRAEPVHVVTVATEHRAVLDPCRKLESRGLARLTVLGVDVRGHLDLNALAEAISDDTALVSVMAANNEIGTIAPIEAIAGICADADVLLHTDATQAVGRIPVDVERWGVDLLSCSAHKLYGPKGTGALYVRSRTPRIRFATQLDGGGHERGLRSGTLNVPGIVGFGAACLLAEREMEAEGKRVAVLRDRLEARLRDGLDEVQRNGDPESCLPGNLNLSFGHIEAESLLLALDREVALSSGSACTSVTLEPSHVLRAIGLRDDHAQGSIRFGLWRDTTEAEVDFVARRVVEEVRRLRSFSPLYGVDSKPGQENRA